VIARPGPLSDCTVCGVPIANSGCGLPVGGRGQGGGVTDRELVLMRVAQVLLRYDDARHWLVRRTGGAGTPFTRLLAQSEYNQRVKNAGRCWRRRCGG